MKKSLFSSDTPVIDYDGFFNSIINLELQEIVDRDLFLSSLGFILDNMPKNVMAQHKMKTLIRARYVNGEFVNDCVKDNKITHGYFYYWVKKATTHLRKHVNSLILSHPLAILLLIYRKEKGDNPYMAELYRMITVNRIGIAEMIYAYYGAMPKVRTVKLNKRYQDGKLVSYANMVKKCGIEKMTTDRRAFYDSFVEFIIEYCHTECGEWVIPLMKLFEKSKPFTKELEGLFVNHEMVTFPH